MMEVDWTGELVAWGDETRSFAESASVAGAEAWGASVFACCTGWWRVICWLDNVNRLLPDRLVITRLCDLHDRHITADAAGVET